KVNGRMHKGPNGAGLSRKAIFAEIDASLKRLGTDFVDLYQIHRWDDTVPIEETLEALNDVVRAGKALHIGASSMFAWQFATALIVGATRLEQLDAAVAALSLQLSPEDVAELEAPYVPHPIIGHE